MPATLQFDATDHLAWCRGIAHGVAQSCGISGQDEEDIQSAAVVKLLECGQRFDPARAEMGEVGGAFRGFAHLQIQAECRREARRMRNGGTYHVRREGEREPVMVQSIGDMELVARFDVDDEGEEVQEVTLAWSRGEVLVADYFPKM